MLAVTANWLLTDGSMVPAPAAAADAWCDAIRRAVIRAGFRRDGRYAPAESVSLVFAGDTFDWLLSDVWGSRERPWHAGARSREARARVAFASLRASRRLLGTLRRWSRLGIPVPGADVRGRPSARDIVHSPIQIVMLVGDRDRWLSEGALDNAGSSLRSGLWIGESWSDGRVTVRHGHDRDPMTHALGSFTTPGSGRAPALAESLAIDLVVPFVLALKTEPAVWQFARSQVAQIAAAGPVAMPRAVARLAARSGATSPAGRLVLSAWRRSVHVWRKRARREPPACDTEHEVVEAVADWFAHAVERVEIHVPSAITRMAVVPTAPANPGMIVGHGGANENRQDGCGPWLTVVTPRRSVEPLGRGAADAPVVTIGPHAGGSIVEAA